MNIFGTIMILALMILYLLIAMWPISLPFFIFYLYKRNKNKKEFKNNVVYYPKSSLNYVKDNYVDIDAYKLEHFDANDLGMLKNYFSTIILDFEKAYNNIDYNALFNICGNSLYNMYKTNLQMNSKFGEKKIIDNVSIQKLVVYNSKKGNGEHIVNVMARIRSISYTQNSDGKIISGSPMNPIDEEFDITFVKELNEKNKDQMRCPNCGAVVNSTKCDYCKTEFKNYDFRIESFKKLVEER